MKIRFATLEDSNELLSIYSQYIETPITFEYTLPSEADFKNRIKNIMTDYPYLVCENQGKVVAYAYAHRQLEREAYQWNAELSIYIDKNFTSNGLGKKMYLTLIELLQKQGLKTVYALVTSPNEKSEKLHLSLGFKKISTHQQTGYKNGSWHDVMWFEKSIAPYDLHPSPIQSITKLSHQNIQLILEKYL